MSFASKVIDYHFQLKANWKIPKNFELIFPFGLDETKSVFSAFYEKYFSDDNQRIGIFGINPGRHGAGVTGVPFTDPFYLENHCAISNSFPKRKELSAIFIYELIDAMGGAEAFYSQFYISSVCPLGFLKDGINANYYDDKKLTSKVTKRIVDHLNSHIQMGCSKEIAFSLGKGKNFKFLKGLNDEHHFFENVIALPHPRWVMQYKRKTKDEHLSFCKEALEAAI